MGRNNPAFSQLKNIFGAENVQEVMRRPPTFSPLQGETWCYEVTLPAESSLFENIPASRSQHFSWAADIEDAMEEHLHNISLHLLDNRASLPDGMDPRTPEKDIPPQKLVFIHDEIEQPENVAALKTLSLSVLRQAVSAARPHDDSMGGKKELHIFHQHLLRRAAHGVRWESVSDVNGEYYRTVKPLRHPMNMQDAILSTLGVDETYRMVPQDNRVCIAADAMTNGKVAHLMDSEFQRRPTLEGFARTTGAGIPTGPRAK